MVKNDNYSELNVIFAMLYNKKKLKCASQFFPYLTLG